MSMPRNDDGEFELILGNKQLLSVFFIVIILLGVFFTMGYIVGRNSGPADAAKKNQAGDPITQARTDGQSAMPAAAAPTVIDPVSKSAATTGAAQETAPPPPVAAPVAEAKPAATENTKPPVQKPVEVSAVTPSVVQPIPGQIYIQVLALGKPEAELLAEVLTKKGFNAIVAPGPNERLFRVLVGPAKDAGDAGKIKGDLEQAGFKQAFPKKF
jgi:cell division septation protein DedD